MAVLVVLKDGQKFVGKRIWWNLDEGFGEITYKVVSSDTFTVGQKIKIQNGAISYKVYQEKVK